MAFVPSPIKHDLFLSYAHQDVAWVNAFEEQLSEQLRDRLGPDCSIWQDENEIRTGQNWPAALDEAIRASAAFIAVISRHYQTSKWCERELDAFLAEAERQDALETGGFGRVLKVIKFPWLYDAHQGFLSNYQHVPFFDRDAKTGQEREFKHTTEPFRKAVKTLSFHIEKLFEAMLRAKEKVFVARTADDVSEERESIIREIKAAGYALSPPPLGAVARRLDRKTLLKYITETTRVSVHLLGAAADPDARAQIDLALEAEKKVVFCLMRGHEAATGDQKLLIEEIRENKRDLAEGAWALLEGPLTRGARAGSDWAPRSPTASPIRCTGRYRSHLPPLRSQLAGGCRLCSPDATADPGERTFRRRTAAGGRRLGISRHPARASPDGVQRPPALSSKSLGELV